MQTALKKAALKVLKNNDRKLWFAPSRTIYPHQWLWDSCFSAIGFRHIDAKRAAREIETLLEGQWQNGMLPHMLFRDPTAEQFDFWKSRTITGAPAELATSGITQPPLVATAALKVSEKLPKASAQKFLNAVYPSLVRYHEWIYRERNPAGKGLAVLIHPWESGMDNTPPWVQVLQAVHRPLLLSIILKARLNWLFRFIRRDTRVVPLNERITSKNAILLGYLARLYQKCDYDNSSILQKRLFAVEGLEFNAILIAANRDLGTIASKIKQPLPKGLKSHIKKTETAIEDLWDERTNQYYPYDLTGKSMIRQPNAAVFLPLYAGSISKAHAAHLVELLTRDYQTLYQVASVPPKSRYFVDRRYWQGPVWININWLIIEGLKRYGYDREAETLRKQTLDLIERAGFYEYFSPLTGKGHGIHDFSWTAALAIELLEN